VKQWSNTTELRSMIQFSDLCMVDHNQTTLDI